MENIEYKNCLVEIISLLKDKAAYLKMMDADSPTFNKNYFDGMAMAYYFAIDGVKEYLRDIEGIDLKDFGLDDFDPKEIYRYKPLHHNEK